MTDSSSDRDRQSSPASIPGCSSMFPAATEGKSEDVPGCSPVFPDVPGRSGMPPSHQIEKTNPILPGLPRDVLPGVGLTSRQLFAARMLIRNMSTDAIAGRLKTTRQTINRWKKRPEFVAEVKRLHEMLMFPSPHSPRASTSVSQPSRPAPPRNLPASKSDVPYSDDDLESILRHYGK